MIGNYSEITASATIICSCGSIKMISISYYMMEKSVRGSINNMLTLFWEWDKLSLLKEPLSFNITSGGESPAGATLPLKSHKIIRPTEKLNLRHLALVVLLCKANGKAMGTSVAVCATYKAVSNS